MTRGKVELSELEQALAGIAPELPGRAYWPHQPTARQELFIGREEEEGLYGGAAGGGKSDALLMDAALHVGVKGYSALILRKTYTDLALPGAIMDRAKTWWAGKVRWNEQDKRFTFPSGATITFGFIRQDQDKLRYQSAEFQYIAFDELTQFAEKTYTYMRSRLRGPATGPLSKVPKRLRGATNPGNIGNEWVHQRFVDESTRRAGAFFVPAFAADNPHLDNESYQKMLEGLDDESRAHLRDGSWERSKSNLVYPFSPAKNMAPIGYKYSGPIILGIDYGYSDACAFVEVGWEGNTTIVLRAYQEEGMTPTRAAEHAEKWEKERGGYYAIVGDGGGLGKGYVEETNERGNVRVELAEKSRKQAFIRFMRADMERGLVRLMPEAKPLQLEWGKLPWNEGRTDYAPGFSDHLADAALYAWRASPAYAHRNASDEKVPTEEEREDIALAKMDEDLFSEAKEGRNAWMRKIVRWNR